MSHAPLKAAVLIATLAYSGFGSAAAYFFKGQVTELIYQPGVFGTCMAKLNPGPQSTPANCAADFVTFSCSGDFNSKQEGAVKYSAAQLAFVTGQELKVRLDDTRKHNGFCFAVRVDNIGS